MLIITTSQKDPKIIDALLKQVLPYVGTPHKVVPFSEDVLEYAQAGDLVLGMGGAFLDLLKASDAFPKVKKNTSMKSLRGTVQTADGINVMLTYDPFLATVDPAKEPEIVWDVQLACRFHDTGSLMPQIGSYKWVEDFTEVGRIVEAEYARTGKAVPVSPDLETIGLDWLAQPDPETGFPGARIVTISFSPKEGTAFVYRVPADGMPTPLVLEQIRWLLTSRRVNSVGANLKFDVNWIAEHWGIECTNQKADTMLIGSLLDENRSNSLNLHAKQYTTMGGYDDSFNASFDKGRMDLALDADPDAFLTYAGGDTDACLRTYGRMRAELVRDKRMASFYVNLLQPAAKVFSKVERRGVIVDRERYLQLQSELEAEVARLRTRCLEHVPRRLQIKHAEKKDMLSSPPALFDFLFTPNGLNLQPKMFTEKSQKPSTAMEHLEMFHDNPDAAPFIDAMKELNSAKKTLSTYIVGFMKHLRADDRFHPTYMLHRGDYDGGDSGTVTGRTSVKDPAWQTIPKHTKWAKKLRSVYVPPPGYAILKADYSQGELRVTACVADEPNMIATYQKGIDLHLRTGALVNNITLDEALQLLASKDPEAKARIKRIRQGGKAGNFGLIYGMSAEGFMNFARVTYGVILTLKEAEAFRNAYFAEYPLLLKWHERYKERAHMTGHVRSPLGRVRHLPLINSKDRGLRAESERQSINSPIQSCLSDMMQLALVELDRQWPDLWIFGMTHDDMGCYVPEDEVDIWAPRLKHTLQNLPLHLFDWAPQLEFVADIEVSNTSLADCEELAVAA